MNQKTSKRNLLKVIGYLLFIVATITIGIIILVYYHNAGFIFYLLGGAFIILGLSAFAFVGVNIPHPRKEEQKKQQLFQEQKKERNLQKFEEVTEIDVTLPSVTSKKYNY